MIEYRIPWNVLYMETTKIFNMHICYKHHGILGVPYHILGYGTPWHIVWYVIGPRNLPVDIKDIEL